MRFLLSVNEQLGFVHTEIEQSPYLAVDDVGSVVEREESSGEGPDSNHRGEDQFFPVVQPLHRRGHLPLPRGLRRAENINKLSDVSLVHQFFLKISIKHFLFFSNTL